MPIEYRNAPAGYLIKEQGANRAEVTLSGNERAFSLPMRKPWPFRRTSATSPPAHPDSFPPQAPADLPSGLTVTSVEPRQVPITLERLSPNELSP